MFSFFGRRRKPPEPTYTSDLPPEIWLHIFHYLSLYDLASIMRVTRFFLPLAHSNAVFKHKVSQYFPSATRHDDESCYDVFADGYRDQFGALKSIEMRKLLAYIYERQWDRIAELRFWHSELLDERDGNNVSILTHIGRQNSQTLFDIVFKQMLWHPDSYKNIYDESKILDDEIYKLAVACNQIDIVMGWSPSCYAFRKQDPKKFFLSFYEFLHVCIKFNHTEIFTYLWDILDNPENNNLGEIHIDPRADRYYPPYKFIRTAAKHGSTSIIHLLAASRLRVDPQLQHFDDERFEIFDAFIAACGFGNYDAFVTLSSYFPSILEECVLHRDEHLLAIAIQQDRENFLKYICSKVDIRNVTLTRSEWGAIEAAIRINYVGGIRCLLEHRAALSDDILEFLNQYKLNGVTSLRAEGTPVNISQATVNLLELLSQYQPQPQQVFRM